MQDILMRAFIGIAEILLIALSGLATYYIQTAFMPWLKEHRLYTTIKKFAQAAEKLGMVGTIPKSEKKAYVVRHLTDKGIKITPEIEALIESAVYELDHVTGELIGGIVGDEEEKEE